MRITVLLLIVTFFISGSSFADNTSGSLAREETIDLEASFELQDAYNKTHRLSDYRGKWVIVNFWATWCGPCIKEIPELKRFYQRHREKGVAVIGINFEELTEEQLKQAIGEFAIDYPVLRIGSEPLVPFEPLKGLPSTFAVSPDGQLVKSWLGPVDEKKLEDYILPRLADKRARATVEKGAAN